MARLYSQLADFLLEASLLKIVVDSRQSIDDEIIRSVESGYAHLQELLKTYSEAKLYLPHNVAEDIWHLLSPADVALRRAKAGIANHCEIGPLKGTLSTISIAASVSSVLPEFHSLLGVEPTVSTASQDN